MDFGFAIRRVVRGFAVRRKANPTKKYVSIEELCTVRPNDLVASDWELWNADSIQYVDDMTLSEEELATTLAYAESLIEYVLQEKMSSSYRFVCSVETVKKGSDDMYASLQRLQRERELTTLIEKNPRVMQSIAKHVDVIGNALGEEYYGRPRA